MNIAFKQCIHTRENGMAQFFKMTETTNNTKRNVFGSNHQNKLQGLQSESRTVGQFHCTASAAY